MIVREKVAATEVYVTASQVLIGYETFAKGNNTRARDRL